MASATTTTNVAAASQYTGSSGVGTLGSGGAGGVPSSPVTPSQQQHQFPDMIKARLAVAAAAANSNAVQTQVCDTSKSTRMLGFSCYVRKTEFA
jgi:hypothetical protein